jgi:hypothetical protein
MPVDPREQRVADILTYQIFGDDYGNPAKAVSFPSDPHVRRDLAKALNTNANNLLVDRNLTGLLEWTTVGPREIGQVTTVGEYNELCLRHLRLLTAAAPTAMTGKAIDRAEVHDNWGRRMERVREISEALDRFAAGEE